MTLNEMKERYSTLKSAVSDSILCKPQAGFNLFSTLCPMPCELLSSTKEKSEKRKKFKQEGVAQDCFSNLLCDRLLTWN